jgi:hypothetical protein
MFDNSDRACLRPPRPRRPRVGLDSRRRSIRFSAALFVVSHVRTSRAAPIGGRGQGRGVMSSGRPKSASTRSARNLYELPLLEKFLDDKFRMRELTFRYAPGKGCTDPPLSWQLTAAEKKCIADAWDNAQVREARQQVVEWLRDVH